MENFHQAIFPPEVTVCGRRLRAFTAWHHLLLRALQSPLLDPAGRLTPGHLLLAVAVCRSRWPHPPRLRPTLRDLWWRWRLDRDPALFRRHATAFGGWLDCSLTGPLLWTKRDSKGHGPTAPETVALVYGLTSKAGVSEQSAWDKPLGLAQWIIGTVAELNGAEISFADPAELTPDRDPYQPTTREEVLLRATRDLGEQAAQSFIQRWDQARHS